MDEPRDYYEVVEQFLELIYHKNVGGVVLVALLEGDKDQDIIASWNVSAHGLAMAAGVIQMHAAVEKLREDEGDDADDGDE